MANRTLILNRFSVVATTVVASFGFVLAFGLAGCNQQKFGIQAASEEFGQKVTYNTEVEVLWVVDTSSSMQQYQEMLSEQAGIFLGALQETKLNYQIAVTTMDMSAAGEQGRFLAKTGTPTILTSSTPGLSKVFAERLVAGESGSMKERGREAMKAALTSASATSGTNAGFLRPNSLLVVIFLSNEKDLSDSSIDYAAYLDQVRPKLPSGERSWIAHFMGVLPDDANCKTSAWNDSSPGVQYVALAEASGGVAESICDSDFRRALTNVKARILEVMTEYKLDRKPALPTLQVLVDGKEVVQSEVDGWTYFAGNNSIRFHGSAVPKPDSSIKVKFDPATLE